MQIRVVATTIALVMAPSLAFAQKKEATPQEIEAKRKSMELDQQYQDAMKRTPSSAVPTVDPWSNVRTSAPEHAAKASKKLAR